MDWTLGRKAWMTSLIHDDLSVWVDPAVVPGVRQVLQTAHIVYEKRKGREIKKAAWLFQPGRTDQEVCFFNSSLTVAVLPPACLYLVTMAVTSNQQLVFCSRSRITWDQHHFIDLALYRLIRCLFTTNFLFTFDLPYIVVVILQKVEAFGNPEAKPGAHCTEVTNNIRKTPDNPEHSP